MLCIRGIFLPCLLIFVCTAGCGNEPAINSEKVLNIILLEIGLDGIESNCVIEHLDNKGWSTESVIRIMYDPETRTWLRSSPHTPPPGDELSRFVNDFTDVYIFCTNDLLSA